MEQYPNPKAEQISPSRGLGAQLLAMAAQEGDNADIMWVNRRVCVASIADRRILFDGSICNESALGARIINDKLLTKTFLQKSGVATPAGELANSVEHAVEIASGIGGAVAIKPRNAGRGRGVSVSLSTEQDIRAAYHRAYSINRAVVVEQYIDFDEEYRCISTPWNCVSVVKRVLPFVTGDGKATIRELINRKNSERQANPALRNRPIPIDELTEATLARQGLALGHVLATDTAVTVRNVGGLSNGGEPHEYSETADEHLKDAATAAISAIPGLEWGGVDIVTERGTGRHYVLEINASSDFGGATFPVEGRPRDVAAEAWRLRRKMRKPDPQDPPTVPRRLRSSPRLERTMPKVFEATDTIPLADLLFAQIAEKGGAVLRESGRVVRIERPGHPNRWFTSDGAGANDLLAVRRALRRHVTVRKLLGARDIPLPNGRRTVGSAEMGRYFAESPGPKAATRIDSARGRPVWHLVDERSHARLFEDSNYWFVQEYPAGVRLRIFTKPEEVIAVVLRSQKRFLRLPRTTLGEAAEVAVAATRAIPEINLVAVDVVIPDTAGRDGNRVLVERLLSNPVVTNEDRLIAGNLDDVFESILDSRY